MMNPDLLVLRIPAILIALTIHEFAHGWVAYKLGDNTARDAGRLTLNPVAHLDLMGSLMLLFGPFGWAKPVPVNGYNFENPKRDILLVSLAGPVSNIILALIFGYATRIFGVYWPSVVMNHSMRDFLYLCIMLNIGISFFNLIPVPPLDGSKILLGILPNKWIPGYLQKSRYIPMIFMGLLIAEWGLRIPLFSRLIMPFYQPYLSVFNYLIFGKAL